MDVPISLSMRTIGPETNNPVTIYHQAVGFYYGGHRCLLSIPIGPKTVQSLVAPSIVNFVFSIELFLKSIIVKSGTKPKKIHKIKELVNDCPDDIIDKVRKEYDQVCQSPNFQEIIEIVNEMFVQVRYQYEYNVNVMYESAVIIFANALFIVCEELHTS
jgi:hypothetical protein